MSFPVQLSRSPSAPKRLAQSSWRHGPKGTACTDWARRKGGRGARRGRQSEKGRVAGGNCAELRGVAWSCEELQPRVSEASRGERERERESGARAAGRKGVSCMHAPEGRVSRCGRNGVRAQTAFLYSGALTRRALSWLSGPACSLRDAAPRNAAV